MSRYFIELFYKGTAYSGFQSQKNANTVQAEVANAFHVLHRREVNLVGSSRTDAGVHANQNYFHFDFDEPLDPKFIYKMNAILPPDIVLRKLLPVAKERHCRFDAVSRDYRYFIYQSKNPFLADRAYYYPFKINEKRMQEAASQLLQYGDFSSFSKRRTQVKSFACRLTRSEWRREADCLVYHVVANRFLRGMVKALVGTMLQVGRGKIDLAELVRIVEARDCREADFSAPSHGLFLESVFFPKGYFEAGVNTSEGKL